MDSSRIRSTAPRRLSWLLWLGVLFALAQAAANVHAISHLGADAGRLRDGGLGHAQCDLCLIGASIGGAVPHADPPVATHPALGHVFVADDARSVHPGAAALAYRSRAPPAAPR